MILTNPITWCPSKIAKFEMKNSFLVNCHLNIADLHSNLKGFICLRRRIVQLGSARLSLSFDGLQPFQGLQAELSGIVAAQINRLQLSYYSF
jgi:hypothetical protein